MQNSDCKIYAKWELGKKNACHIKLPVSIHECYKNQDDGSTFSTLDIAENYSSYIDYDSKIKKFHEAMKGKITNVEWKVYNYLYIENKDEIETAKLMGYKTSEKNRSPGYKQIKKIKNKIYKLAKVIILNI